MFLSTYTTIQKRMKPIAPQLIDPEIRFLLNDSLQQYHQQSTRTKSIIINCILVFGLVVSVGGYLYYKKKQKDKANQQLAQKQKEVQDYLAAKMKIYHHNNAVNAEYEEELNPFWRYDKI